MPKALLLSIRPRFADAIFTGNKYFELRKVKPKVQPGDLVLVYVTSPRCTLEGAFKVNDLLAMPPAKLWPIVRESCALTRAEFNAYYAGKETAYAIQIADTWLLEKTQHLKELKKRKIVPPQSYQYLSERQTASLLGTSPRC